MQKPSDAGAVPCLYYIMLKNSHAGVTQVMKAGTTPAQRRRLGDQSLIVAMDPQTKRLLRYEEVRE